MKQPPGLWVLLSAGVLLLSLQGVYGIRATSLIFGKTSSTSTTTEPPAKETASEENGEASTDALSAVNSTTKSPLTGNPQVDYLLDPNLPKELNGANLTEYPFFERVPEVIDFKCDGLHDGFYANVQHKCQVYHHCLFGTRYDFLCANYTAFDQKTFICQFVSEVDCVNSKKFWHRNDALYKATTTTTLKPITIATPPPTAATRRSNSNRRRPTRRRRPQYDYDDEPDYGDDDYYEERPRRRNRPRPRRPLYDDDDYPEEEVDDDDRFDRRGNRKTYAPRRRNKDRRRDEYEDEEPRYKNRRPQVADEERRGPRPKAPRRPLEDDYEEEKPIVKPTSGSSIYDRPRTAPRIKPPVPKNEAGKYAYKPALDDEYEDEEEEEEPARRKKLPEKRLRPQSSQHDEVYEEEQPRKRNKPLVEEAPRKRNKTPLKESDDEVEELPKKRSKPPPVKDEVVEEASSRRPHNNRAKAPPKIEEEAVAPKRSLKERPKPAPKEAAHEEEPSSQRPTRYGAFARDKRPKTTKKPEVVVEEEYYDDYDEEPTSTTTTGKPLTSPPKSESIVRIVKRPFLASRGGSPFAGRGLQPVGAKALDLDGAPQAESNVESMEIKPMFKPSPALSPQEGAQVFRGNFKAGGKEGPRTTQKPKDTNPLDLVDEEFDVTLNDALNPTLPNVPVRSFPTGFSGGDYGYNYAQRPRYVADGGSSSDLARGRLDGAAYGNPQEQFVNSNADYKGQYSTIQGQSYRPSSRATYFSHY